MTPIQLRRSILEGLEKASLPKRPMSAGEYTTRLMLSVFLGEILTRSVCYSHLRSLHLGHAGARL